MNMPMNQGGWTFDARTVTPQTNLEPLPDGWYKVVITKTNIKPTKAEPNNSMMAFELKVIEGQFTGRTAYHNLNLWHSSQQTVEIAYKQMSAICYVTGVFQIAAQQGADNVLPMLHNIPFYVHLIISQGTQGPINNVRGLKDINGNEPGKTGGGPMPGGVQQPAPQVQQAGPQAGWSSQPQGQPGPQQQPSQMAAPGGWQGQPQGGPAPQQQPQPQQWGAPQGGPGPGPQQQPGPGSQAWGQAPQPQQGTWGQQPQQQPQPGYQQPQQQPGPAPQQWGGQGGAPQGGPPQGQAWQGAPGMIQGQPGAPQGQQWQQPGGQPAGGPQGPQGPWGR